MASHWYYLLLIPAWGILLWMAGRFEVSLYPKPTNRVEAAGYGVLAGCAGIVAWAMILGSALWAIYMLATG